MKLETPNTLGLKEPTMPQRSESGMRIMLPGFAAGIALSSVLLAGCSMGTEDKRADDVPAKSAATCGVEGPTPGAALLDAGDIWRPIGKAERSATLIEYRSQDCNQRPKAALNTTKCDQFPWSPNSEDLYSLGVRKIATASFQRTDQGGEVSQVKEQVLVQKEGSDLGDIYRDGAKSCGGSVLASVNGKASSVLIKSEGKNHLLIIDDTRVLSIEASLLDVTALSALEKVAVKKADKLG